MLTTFINTTISYFEQLLGVNFTKKSENKYRAKEHSSYLLFKGKDDALRFQSFNGDYGDQPLNAYQLTKQIFPNLTGREIWEKIGQPLPPRREETPRATPPPTPKAEKIAIFHANANNEATLRTFQYFEQKIAMRSMDDLQRFDIKTIKEYGKVKSEWLACPLFAYCESGNIKIKDPQKRVFSSKVMLKTPIKEYVYGYKELLAIDNQTAKNIHAVIAEGEDDVLAVNYHGKMIRAITFGGVSNQFKASIIQELKAKFASVSVAFDNDSAGQKGAMLQAQKFDLPYFVCPTLPKKEGNSKDFCDLLKDINFDATRFELLIQNEIVKAINTKKILARPLHNDYSNFDLFIASRRDMVHQIQCDTQAVVVCEEAYRAKLRELLDDPTIPIYTYQDLSKIGTRYTNRNIYIFGSQYFLKKYSSNTARTLKKIGTHDMMPNHIILTADVDIDLPFAGRKYNVLNDYLTKTIFNIVVAEHPYLHAAFVKTVQKLQEKDNGVQYLECNESVMRQLGKKGRLNKAALPFADRNKTLVVLMNRDLNLLPVHFQGFKEVIFVCSDKVTDMLTPLQWQMKQINTAEEVLTLHQNNLMQGKENKLASRLSKLKIGAIPNLQTGRFELCNIENTLQKHLYQCNVYANNYHELARDLSEKYTVNIQFFNPTSTEDLATIQADIKQEIQQLKQEKKDEFKAFFDNTEAFKSLADALAATTLKKVNIVTETGEQKTITTQRELNRGEKEAVKRLKEISQYVDFDLARPLVANSYANYQNMLSRSIAAALMQTPDGESNYADRLKTFGKAYSNNGWHTKAELVRAWREQQLAVDSSDKEVWKQLKKSFFTTSINKRVNGKCTRVYQIILLD
jgi:hypothetical protein